MSVGLAKALFNHKMLVRLQNKICAAIGVANHEVDAKIAERLANNPFIRLGKNETSANLNQKHGYHYEYAKLLLEEIVKHDKANKGAAQVTNVANTTRQSANDSHPYDDEDIFADELFDDENTLQDMLEFMDGVDSESLEQTNLTSNHQETLPSTELA
eukprot:scaffold99238_cov37-Cyclotella_meneghiniana.AAC.1